MFVMPTTSMASNMEDQLKGLEKHLENDYGEFEFIDEGATLTRTLKTNGETVKDSSENRKSMFSFSDEVFDELEKAGTLKRPSNFDHQPSQLQNVQDEYYETYGAWRSRQQNGKNRYGQNGQITNNNMLNSSTSVTNNTSAKLQALIQDQTLLLRHHKRRQRKWHEEQQAKTEAEKELQSLIILQKQLAEATKEHLEGGQASTRAFFQGPLRRCSSLSQTGGLCEAATDVHNLQQPPAKINGTSPLTSSPWLSTSNSGTSNSTRYLYRGKFNPTNNNNGGPWQLRSNLSSFARRRRGSSTSLHTFSDSEDTNSDLNNQASSSSLALQVSNKKPQPDSISLAGSEESVNHR